MTGKVLRIRKRYNWIQGVYRSPKSMKLHNFKSSWELNLYKFLDGCKYVKAWESECVKIPYKYRGRVKRYLPDVLINNRLLLEVKPKNQIGWPINVAKFRSAKEFCKVKGWSFKVVTKELLNPIYLTEQIIGKGE